MTNLGEKVDKAWSNNSGKHLSINIAVRHWPAISPVMVERGKKVKALHGPSFSKQYFMGIANISKMESKSPVTNYSVKITMNIMETESVLILTAQERRTLLSLYS